MTHEEVDKLVADETRQIEELVRLRLEEPDPGLVWIRRAEWGDTLRCRIRGVDFVSSILNYRYTIELAAQRVVRDYRSAVAKARAGAFYAGEDIKEGDLVRVDAETGTVRKARLIE